MCTVNCTFRCLISVTRLQSFADFYICISPVSFDCFSAPSYYYHPKGLSASTSQLLMFHMLLLWLDAVFVSLFVYGDKVLFQVAWANLKLMLSCLSSLGVGMTVVPEDALSLVLSADIIIMLLYRKPFVSQHVFIQHCYLCFIAQH